MKIAVVGTGYVGLVTGTCFAEKGNDVTCVDIDAEKVKHMEQGEVPIYEPGLEEMFRRNLADGRLSFTTDLATGTRGAEVIFLALPTPEAEDGSADLTYVLGVAENLGKILKDYTVIVNKSTVPVGTADKVSEAVSQNINSEFDVVSNPEFLREGQAVEDFMHPDRIVIGVPSERAKSTMTRLYRDFVRRSPEASIQITDTKSAEMIKYAANSFLATKITFINELAELAKAVGADIEEIRKGIGSDSRIGSQFLYPGPGYGGSCFPKDTLALRKTAWESDVNLAIVDSTIEANEKAKLAVPKMILDFYQGDVAEKRFALWGLAFKDNTDDIRYSPALKIAEELVQRGAYVTAFDPQAMDNVRKKIERDDDSPMKERLSFSEDEYSVLHIADALVIATNWGEFDNPDFTKIKSELKSPVIFDGRNRYEPETMQELGFRYECIGRKVVDGRKAK